jgi:hypothetical protein
MVKILQQEKRVLAWALSPHFFMVNTMPAADAHRYDPKIAHENDLKDAEIGLKIAKGRNDPTRIMFEQSRITVAKQALGIIDTPAKEEKTWRVDAPHQDESPSMRRIGMMQ